MKKKIRIVVDTYGTESQNYSRFKAITKDWEYMTCIFCKSTIEKPIQNCTITVDVKNISIQKGDNPILFVRKIDSISYRPDADFMDRMLAEVDKYF